MEPPGDLPHYGFAKFAETDQRGEGYRLRVMVASGVVGLASEARSTASPYVDAHGQLAGDQRFASDFGLRTLMQSRLSTARALLQKIKAGSLNSNC